MGTCLIVKSREGQAMNGVSGIDRKSVMRSNLRSEVALDGREQAQKIKHILFCSPRVCRRLDRRESSALKRVPPQARMS
jgi:hypothetical protein